MQAPHNPHDAMLARRVGNQPPTLLESSNAAHQDEVPAAAFTQVVHANARAEDRADGVDVNLPHGRFLVDVGCRVEDVLVDGDARVGDYDVHAAVAIVRSPKEAELVGVFRGVAVDKLGVWVEFGLEFASGLLGDVAEDDCCAMFWFNVRSLVKGDAGMVLLLHSWWTLARPIPLAPPVNTTTLLARVLRREVSRRRWVIARTFNEVYCYCSLFDVSWDGLLLYTCPPRDYAYILDPTCVLPGFNVGAGMALPLSVRGASTIYHLPLCGHLASLTRLVRQLLRSTR